MAASNCSVVLRGHRAGFLSRAAPCCPEQRRAPVPATRLRSTSNAAASSSSTTTAPPRSRPVPDFIDASLLAEISEPAAQEHARRMQRVPVPMQSWGDDAELMTAVAGPTEEELAAYPPEAPAIVLLHSFDSSNMEFRRLYPLLAEQCPTYAVDLVGWGFTDHTPFSSQPSMVLGPSAKREHLGAFLRSQGLGAGGRPVVLLGTSVGGAIALDFALAEPQSVSRLVLLSAQCFIDGIGPMASLPRPLAALGVQVLKQEWLRQAANEAAYYDKAAYATKDAMRVGRLHTHGEGWADANVAFMRSGGYALSQRVREVEAAGIPTLILWGRDDKILEPSTALRFQQELPSSRLVWVERCGHSPHLEHAAFTAQQVLGFALGEAEAAAN